MRKISLLVILVFTLFGCQKSSGIVQNYILEKSGVLDSPDYISYLQKYENGQVDEEGYLITNDDTDVTDGRIKISFVSNNHFDVDYYIDKNLEYKISENNCYLKPGDDIYAAKPVIKNIIESSYSFKNYEIYTYEDKVKKVIDIVQNDSGLIYTIPQDFNGNSISICPIGEFQPCNLTFSSYIKNETSKSLTDSIWKVDGEIVKDNQYEFIPNSDFSIECQYPQTDGMYYLLESSILPSYLDDYKGIVRFDHVLADNNELNFSIIIKEYTTINFNNQKDLFSGINVTVSIGEESKKLEKGISNLGKFKAGDEIEICLEKGYKISVNGLYILDVNETTSGDTFIVKVTENSPPDASIGIEKKTSEKPLISNYVKNGILTIYHSDGTPIIQSENVDLNEKIQVMITPNEGFYITGDKVSDNIYSDNMKFSDFKKNYDKIVSNHEIKQYITLILDENDDFGICNYYIGKEKISGTVNELKSGDVIKMEYTITDSGYKIDRLLPFSTIKVDIKVTEEMNFATIKREDYVSIKKKG
ncbi:MAG: hypothetical protein SOW61_00495 [Erysipelotrichaceae bacterium]|nr:hypothetical protein [Erysipelotrichaceae bacterium]